MILPDVNVLVYAFRSDVPQHALCRSWLIDVLSGDGRFALSPLALSAVVRIATNPRLFANPSTLGEAFGYCGDLLGHPHCEIVEPGERHWAIFERLCKHLDIRGPRVSDAWYAALAIEWGCEWVTFDRDFARFPGLRWYVPTAL
jgi:toxin-antitoxin system PIN domain toxin